MKTKFAWERAELISNRPTSSRDPWQIKYITEMTRYELAIAARKGKGESMPLLRAIGGFLYAIVVGSFYSVGGFLALVICIGIPLMLLKAIAKAVLLWILN